MSDELQPGLQGNFHGTCVACLTPTDTALGFEGEAEFVIAGISVLGVPMDQAQVMVEEGEGAATPAWSQTVCSGSYYRCAPTA
jgi:hypothetical protein